MATTTKFLDFLRRILDFFSGSKRKRIGSKYKDKYEDKYYYMEKQFYSSLDQLEEKIDLVSENQQSLQEEIHSYLAMRSLGIDPNTVPLYQFLPIRVYLTESDPREIKVISESVTAFLRMIGFEISDSFPPQAGSWFKRWFVKSKEVITQPEVTDRLKKAERALELATLQKYQASVDKEQAEAAGTLLRSLEQVPNAVCQIGSILVVKVTDNVSGTRVYTRSLTTREMIYLERNQHLIQNPQRILEALSEYCSHSEESAPEDDFNAI